MTDISALCAHIGVGNEGPRAQQRRYGLAEFNQPSQTFLARGLRIAEDSCLGPTLGEAEKAVLECHGAGQSLNLCLINVRKHPYPAARAATDGGINGYIS